MAGTLTAQSISMIGIAPSLAAVTQAGNSFLNNGKEFIYVKNSNSSNAHQLTIKSQHKCNYSYQHDSIASVPSNGELFLGPYSTAWFNDTNNLCNITYDTGSAADLTIGIFHMD